MSARHAGENSPTKHQILITCARFERTLLPLTDECSTRRIQINGQKENISCSYQDHKEIHNTHLFPARPLLVPNQVSSLASDETERRTVLACLTMVHFSLSTPAIEHTTVQSCLASRFSKKELTQND